MLKHLRNVHKMLVNLKEEDAEMTSKTDNNRNSITEYLKKNKEMKHEKITEAITNYICFDSQPFNKTEQLGFRELMRTLDATCKIPHRTTISRSLEKNSIEVKNQLKKLLYNIVNLSFSTDGWSNDNKEYFTSFFAHFRDSNFKLKTILIDISYMPLSKNFDNMAIHYSKVIDDWDINKKLFYAISDNALTGCFKKLNMENHGCFAHTVHLSIYYTIVGYKQKDKKKIAVCDHFQNISDKIDKFINYF